MTARSDIAPKTVFARSTFGLDAVLPRVSHGQGSWIYDSTGKRYLDGSGGPAVFAIGHANPEVNEAVRAQMDQIAHGYRYLFTSQAADDLAEILSNVSGGQFNNGVLVSSGSEAVESCLKIALQYHAARGDSRRKRFIARERSYHGNTLGALSVSGFATRRASFEGALMPTSFVSAANDYRRPDNVSREGLVPWLANQLEEEILAQGPETIAAFIFEPVVGAAGGVVPAPAGYAQAMAEICRRYGILVIADEVMCGSGRTGHWIAHHEDGIRADITSVAKGLAAGYVPMGAALYSDDVAEVLRGHGGVQSGHTFTGHTAGCAAAVAVQRIIARDGLMDRVRTRGPQLRAEIASALSDLPEVGDVRGRGYFIGVEIVADAQTRTPFPSQLMAHALIGRLAFERGLIIYPCAGNVDGRSGDTLVVAPPYNATEDELAYLVDTLSAALREALPVLRASV